MNFHNFCVFLSNFSPYMRCSLKIAIEATRFEFFFFNIFFCELRQKIHLQPQEINKQKERIFKFTRKIMKDFFFFFADWITLTDLFALCFWTTLLDMREALSFHSYVKWLNVFLVFCCFLFGEFFFFSTFIDQLLLQCYSFFFFFLRVRGRRFISIIFFDCCETLKFSCVWKVYKMLIAVSWWGNFYQTLRFDNKVKLLCEFF